MELADSNVRDELKKLENMFGIPYRMLIRLIGHLGTIRALFITFWMMYRWL